MGERKKAGAGAVFMAVTLAVTVIALVLYLQNCRTNYFTNMGVNSTVAACLAAAAVFELLMLVLSFIMGAKPYLDILPVLSGVLSAVAAIQFIGSRIAGAASIMTFENNAENMADLNNAIVAMVFCVAAMLCVMVSSFFKVVKD